MSEARPPRAVRGPARFREKDVARAIRGAQKAKISIAAVEISVDGAIRIIPGTPVSVATPNPWDEP
jgi:hypothetical protein